MKAIFNHCNINVTNLEKSIHFYKEALGLEPVREKDASDGSFKLVYLGDGVSDFTLELTWLKDRTEPYNLGECEFHLAFHVDDYEGIHKKHEEMGCICYENLSFLFGSDRHLLPATWRTFRRPPTCWLHH